MNHLFTTLKCLRDFFILFIEAPANNDAIIAPVTLETLCFPKILVSKEYIPENFFRTFFLIIIEKKVLIFSFLILTILTSDYFLI